MQTFSYSLRDQVSIDFKLPTYNVFQTPYGFSQFNAVGNLNLKQKAAIAQGS